MLDGKGPQAAPSTTEVDFDVEDERARYVNFLGSFSHALSIRIRSELQAEYDAQVAELKESWSAESQQQPVSANQQTEKPAANQNATQLATERVVEKFEVKMLVGGEQARGLNYL